MAVITRVFEDFATAERARASLEALGTSKVEIAMLGDERMHDHYRAAGHVDPVPVDPARDTAAQESTVAATGAGIGAVAGGGAGLLAGLGMIAIPGLGPLVAAGWLAATAVGAVGGAVVGGALGALTDIGISDADAPVFHEAMRRGHVALTVRFPEEDRAEVLAALDSVSDVALTDLRTRYEADGWRYDDAEAERQERLRNPALGRLPPLV